MRSPKLCGDPIELDRERMHEYAQAQRVDYAVSDGITTLWVDHLSRTRTGSEARHAKAPALDLGF